MKSIVLYGAGKRGRKVAELLRNREVNVSAFCDTKMDKEVGLAKIGGGGYSMH